MRALVLLALVAELAAGCNDSNHPQPPASMAAPASFTVHGTLSRDQWEQTWEQDFVVRVDPVAGTMTIGGAGYAGTVPISSDDGVSFRAGDSIWLPYPDPECGSTVSYSDFHFVAGRESLSGAATGMAQIRSGETSSTGTVQLAFSGVPDVTPPSIVNEGAPVDPLAVLDIIASEPLPAGAQAQLVSASHQARLTSPGAAGSAAAAFQTAADTALRYDTTYKIVIDPWTDLAGNPGAPPNDITTFPSPPLIPGDGFETASDTVGGATIADATVMPPISGEKSALVGSPVTPYPQPARFTVRLAVASGASMLRFSLRQFAVPGGLFSSALTQARIAAPGGKIVDVPLTGLGSTGTDQVLPSGVHITVGDVTPIESPLPAGVGDEIVFDFRTGNYDIACSLPLAIPGYQIDDLRVE
jgi:hypothetical protein